MSVLFSSKSDLISIQALTEDGETAVAILNKHDRAYSNTVIKSARRYSSLPSAGPNGSDMSDRIVGWVASSALANEPRENVTVHVDRECPTLTHIDLYIPVAAPPTQHVFCDVCAPPGINLREAAGTELSLTDLPQIPREPTKSLTTPEETLDPTIDSDESG